MRSHHTNESVPSDENLWNASCGFKKRTFAILSVLLKHLVKLSVEILSKCTVSRFLCSSEAQI